MTDSTPEAWKLLFGDDAKPTTVKEVAKAVSGGDATKTVEEKDVDPTKKVKKARASSNVTEEGVKTRSRANSNVTDEGKKKKKREAKAAEKEAKMEKKDKKEKKEKKEKKKSKKAADSDDE